MTHMITEYNDVCIICGAPLWLDDTSNEWQSNHLCTAVRGHMTSDQGEE